MPKEKKRNRALKIIGKIAGGLIVFIIILVVGIYIFIQTDLFNKWALEFTLNKLNKSWELKENKVDAESLEGNILKGIKLNNGSITVKGDTLVKFASLDVKYDLWALLKHKINLDYVILSSPRINLLGSKDSSGKQLWNYSNLFGPPSTDTTSSPFDWDISVDKFKIENGYARIVGEYNKDFNLNNPVREKLKEFDLNNLDVTNLQLELNAKYSKENKSVNIVNLSFNTNSDFNLKKLSLVSAINITDTVTDVSALEIVTDRSELKINKVNVKDFNPLNGVNYEDFKEKIVDIKIDIAKFNFADLRFFLPDLTMLDSSVALQFEANGKYGNMNISALNLQFLNSTINLKGNIQNLQEPDSLYFDVTVSDLNLQPGDVLTILKGVSIPNYSVLGPVRGNIYYRGTVDNFYTEYDLTTGGGNVNGHTNLNLNTETYNGYVVTQRLNLGKILKNNKLNSNLNISAKFDGSGFALNKMNSSVTYSLNNSSIAGYNVSSSLGDIKTNRNNLDFKVKANSSAGSADVTGKVNISNMKDPIYVLKGKVGNLDISKFTKNASDKSSINTAFDINGRGIDLSNINGKYDFDIQKSNYSQYQIPKTPLNIQINNSGGESSLKVVTDMADINASGTFNFGAVSNSISANVKLFSDAIKNKLNSGTDSSGISASGTSHNSGDNFKFNFEINVKDSAKLNETLQPFGIVFNGAVNGNIENSSNGFKSNVIVKIKDFRYYDSTIVIRNVNTDFSFNNDYSTTENNSLSPFTIKLNTTGDKIIFGYTEIDSAKLDLDLQRSVADIRARARQDTTNSVILAGNFDMSGEKIIANIDSLKAKYGKYEAENNNTWIVSYTPGNEINFQQFAIKSQKAVVNVSGVYSLAGSSDLTIGSDNLPLATVYDAINPQDTTIVITKYKYPVQGELTKFSINYKGTIDNPEISAIVNTNVIKYNDINVGTISAKLDYKDEVITPDITFQNYENKGSLVLSGTVPYKNPLLPQDSAVEFVNNPVALKLTANNFELGYFTKLVPSVGDLRGVLIGEINAAGTASDPQLTGNLAISNGGYFFPLLGMDYGFNMKVSTADSKLIIDRISLLNANDDSKHFDIYGNIDFKGLKINDIDLKASGDMEFLDNSVEANDLGIYGSFEGGSGTPPISIKGNFQKLDVSGQFLIKDATISSVPLNGSGYDVGPDNFVYINASDSAYHTGDSLIAIGPKRYERTNPFEKYKFRLRRPETSVWDFLNLDLNVKTEKDLNIDVSFISLARSKLYGTVQVDLNLKTENKELNAYGNVEVTGNSYFRLYRDFKLKNSRITFNGPIANPSLDLRAIYSGTKTAEQYGAISSIPVEVAAFVKGSVDTPKISFKLIQDGDEITGENADGDAVTFLLFGKFKSDLTESQQSAMASGLGQSVGSYYASSYLTDALREVLPFIVGADFKYSEGDVVKNTDIQVTSEFGDATVKVGGHEVNNASYLEFTIDYPLSKLLNLNLPETLLLEIAREMLTYTSITTTDQQSRTGIKVIYKFRF